MHTNGTRMEIIANQLSLKQGAHLSIARTRSIQDSEMQPKAKDVDGNGDEDQSDDTRQKVIRQTGLQCTK